MWEKKISIYGTPEVHNNFPEKKYNANNKTNQNSDN